MHLRAALSYEIARSTSLQTLAYLRLNARERLSSAEVVRSVLLWSTALRMQRAFSSWSATALSRDYEEGGGSSSRDGFRLSREMDHLQVRLHAPLRSEALPGWFAQRIGRPTLYV